MNILLLSVITYIIALFVMIFIPYIYLNTYKNYISDRTKNILLLSMFIGIFLIFITIPFYTILLVIALYISI